MFLLSCRSVPVKEKTSTPIKSVNDKKRKIITPQDVT